MHKNIRRENSIANFFAIFIFNSYKFLGEIFLCGVLERSRRRRRR